MSRARAWAGRARRILVSCAIWPNLATAQARSAPPAPVPLQVELWSCAPSVESAPLLEAIHDATDTLPLVLVSRARSSRVELSLAEQSQASTGIAARVFVDACQGQARVTVIDRRRGSLLERELPRAGISTQVVHEQLAQIVRASLEALLAIPPPAAPSPEPRKSQAPARPPTAARRLFAGVYYGAGLYAVGEPIVHGPGLFLALRAPSRRPSWAIDTSLEYRFVEHREPSARLRLDILAARCLAALSAAVGPGQLELGLGLGADLAHVSPSAEALTTTLAPSRWRSTLALRAQTRFEARVSHSLELFSLISLDVDPSRTRYVVTLDAERQALTAVRALRPGVGLGLAF